MDDLKKTKWDAFSSDPDQPTERELQNLVERQRIASEVERSGAVMDKLIKTPGWALLEQLLEATINSLRDTLERGDNVDVRAKIYALRLVLSTVRNLASRTGDTI